ncbi:MAG: peptide ABC transporter substrate-binding protein [Chloroflexota bacterium]|nr:peptide ABC transporter substrate-binding protein [Chloroflexota bacterium]
MAMVFFLIPLAGCNEGGVSGGDLVLMGSDPATLDPVCCADATAAGYIVEIFSGLVALDKNLEVVPDIAESWDISADGTVYTFHLRDGVRFHDGREVTAGDFKYSIERAADPAIGSQVAAAYIGDIVGVKEKLDGLADEVSGVRVIDEVTLEITIDAPKAYFLSKLTHPVAFVVDQDNVDLDDEWWREPNGTGPFKLGEWDSEQRIVLERNDHYYRDAANLERVFFLLQGDSMMFYESGGIDIVGVGVASIDRVLDPTNPLYDELVFTPELSLYYIGFNTQAPPFDDVKVRQAFSCALDKAKIVEILYKDTVTVAYGILPSGIPGYNEDLAGLEFDVERAQQLMAESSYADGLPPVVLSVAGSASGVLSADVAIAHMWQENLGVDIELQTLDFSTLINEARDGELQAFDVGWIADYPDPENFLDLLFHCESVENYTGYCNQSVDELLEEARVTVDADARYEIYRQAEEAIVMDAPCIPLWYGQSYYLVKPKVRGFEPAPMIVPMLKDVWIEE